MQNMHKCLELMKNHWLSEKSLGIQEYFKSNLENNRIPSDFDYFMVEVLIIQRPVNRFSR